MKKASIIVLNYNGKRYIKDCLDSVLKQSYPNYEIIVVDNNSSDNSISIIEKYSKAKLIKNKENFGFSKGNNIGIKSANGDYIILLNMDTVVNRDWLKELIKIAETENNIGICQSKILLFDDRSRINTTGNIIHYLGFGYCGECGKKDYQMDVREITYASGASMLIKKHILDKIGYFDESLFMYQEDLDFGWRARLFGYKIVLAPKSIVYHKYKVDKNKNKMYYAERNRLIVLLKNYSFKSLLLISPALILNEVGIFFYFIKEMIPHKKINSYFSILMNSSRIMKDRRYIQKNRIVSDKELFKHFNKNFEFSEINSSFQKIFNLIFQKYGELILRV